MIKIEKKPGVTVMDNQLKLIELLFANLLKNTKKHIEIEKIAGDSYWSENYRNKNHGKVALKRKITMLRQELLNLEKMLDDM